MKKVLQFTAAFASLTVIFAACNTNPFAMQQVPVTDTAGFAQFKEWKAMQEQAVPAPVAYRPAPAQNVTMSSATTHEAKVAKKKGWSKSAKYAVIGGTGGAVLGAIINKRNPVKGAVIGAVVLGGGGYIFGRSRDRKDGRFE